MFTSVLICVHANKLARKVLIREKLDTDSFAHYCVVSSISWHWMASC